MFLYGVWWPVFMPCKRFEMWRQKLLWILCHDNHFYNISSWSQKYLTFLFFRLQLTQCDLFMWGIKSLTDMVMVTSLPCVTQTINGHSLCIITNLMGWGYRLLLAKGGGGKSGHPSSRWRCCSSKAAFRRWLLLNAVMINSFRFSQALWFRSPK